MLVKRILTIFTLSCLLTVSFLIFPSQKAQALSIADYFVYTYDFTFSKTTIAGSETFYLTVNGQATCIQDLPLDATEAYIESRVVASLNGNELVLNPNYTIDYPDFPSKSGETASATMQVPLSFPSGSTGGVYEIIGCINIARVKIEDFLWITITGYLPASQAIGSITYQPVVGGGGGGSTESNPATNLTQYMDENGVFIEDAQALSVDKIVKLLFYKGTRFTIPGGIGGTVTIKSLEKGTEPEPPENNQIIGQAYNFEPEGANFSPPIRMTFSYNETSLPQGAQEKNIVIAWWDIANSKWVLLKDCRVDDTANTVTGLVEHFTILAAIIDMSPAPNFDVSYLSINPLSVKTGESVTITVKATNNGGRTGTLTLILKINGIEEVRKSVILVAGSSETVNFTAVKDVPTTYNIDINGLTGSFTVDLSSSVSDQTPSVPESPSSPDINRIPESQPEAQSEPSNDTEIKPAQVLSDGEPFAWWQVLVPLASGMVLGGFILLLLWHKRAQRI